MIFLQQILESEKERMSAVKEKRTVEREVAVAWICDVCGVQTTNSEQYEQEWFGFIESHQGWGRDSSDSYQGHDVCSVDCFIKQLQESLPDLLEYADDDAEIADMPAKFAQKLLDRLLKARERQ